MATKTVSNNYAEATYTCNNADNLRINVPHLKSSLTNQEIAEFMNDFVLCLKDMLITPPTAMKSCVHVNSTKTYYGV